MSISPRIFVTGAKGQLGLCIKELSAAHPHFSFVFADREELPLDQPEKISPFLDELAPRYIINCGAYTAVDQAEQPGEATTLMTINATAVGEMAAWCKKVNSRLIHFSTDYVFNGNGSSPYTEESPVDPVNAYGASKLAGEREAMKNNDGSLIIRTAWVYSPYGKNFVRTMLRLMKERESVSVVNDQFGSPTYAGDLAAAVLQIISQENNWRSGIYHYSNEGIISWYDFAVAIARLAGLDCEVLPVPTSGFPTPARRPAYSVLDKTKIRDTFGLDIPRWEDSLAICLQKLLAE